MRDAPRSLSDTAPHPAGRAVVTHHEIARMLGLSADVLWRRRKALIAEHGFPEPLPGIHPPRWSRQRVMAWINQPRHDTGEARADQPRAPQGAARADHPNGLVLRIDPDDLGAYRDELDRRSRQLAGGTA